MASELRVNTSTNRVGLGTITYTDTGPIISGITTGNNFKTGTTNVHSTGVELANINTAGATATFGGDISIPDTIVHSGDTNTKIRFPAADTFTVETAGSERFRIDSSGKVRIENTNYSAQAAGNELIVGTTAGDNGITIASGSSGTGNIYFGDGDSNSSGYIRYDHNSNFLKFNVNGSEKLRITSDGKIGIGEDNPDGNYLLIRAATTVGTVKGHIMLTGDGATNGEGPQIVFSESGSGSNFAGAYIGHIRATTNSVGHLVFGTRETGGDANTVPIERLRITSAGKVGIGTDNPARKVEIFDTAATVLQLNSTNTGGTSLRILNSGTDKMYMGLAGDFIVGQTNNVTDSAIRASGALLVSSGGGTERLRITSSGRVGINQTAPQAMLQVDYDYNSSEIGLRLRAATGSGTKTWQLSEINGNAGVFTIRNASNGYNILNIDGANQRIGINNANPSSILHVSGSSTPTILNKPTDASPAIFVGDSNRTGAGQHLAEYRANWNGTLVGRIVFAAGDDTTNKDDGIISMHTTPSGGSSTERLRITSSGTAVFGGNAAAPIVDNGELYYRGNSTQTFENLPQNLYLYSDDIAYNGTNPGAGMVFGGQYSSGGQYTTFAGIHAIKENSTDGQYGGALIFGVRPDGAATPWEKLRITSGGQTRMNPPAANGSSSLISEKQALIGTKHFYSVFHTFSGGAGSVNSPLAVNSKIPTNTCGTVEIMAGWANGNGLRYLKYSWIASGATSLTKRFEDFNSRYGVGINVSTPTMSISGDYVNWSFAFSDNQGNKMENLKIHFEYFHQFRVDG